MITEPKIYDTVMFKDDRGFFKEQRPSSLIKDLGVQFKQENLSFSKKGVVRGLHYQWSPNMGKLVSVVSGSIVDILVDIRKDSKNLGKVFYFNLSSENGKTLWVPPGFAHGFEALENSYVCYGCSEEYSSKSEASININDDFLKINLQTPKECVIMSKRDIGAMSFEEYCSDFKF